MNSPEACRKRLFKYVIPVIIISIIINIPKFLESYIGTYYKVWDAENNSTKTITLDVHEVSYLNKPGPGTMLSSCLSLLYKQEVDSLRVAMAQMAEWRLLIRQTRVRFPAQAPYEIAHSEEVY